MKNLKFIILDYMAAKNMGFCTDFVKIWDFVLIL